MEVFKLYKPALVLSNTGIKFSPDSSEIPWRDINGFNFLCVSSILRTNSIVLYMKLPSLETQVWETNIVLSLLKDGDRAAEFIEKRIQDNKQNGMVDSSDHEISEIRVPNNLHYNGIEFDMHGLTYGRKSIRWEYIEDVYYKKDSMLGYGGLDLRYVNGNGENSIFTISSFFSRKYLVVIQTIVQRAKNARIDPQIYRTLEYPFEKARVDYISSLFTGLGVMVSLVVLLLKASILYMLILVAGMVLWILGKIYRQRVSISTVYLAIVILVTWRI